MFVVVMERLGGVLDFVRATVDDREACGMAETGCRRRIFWQPWLSDEGTMNETLIN